MRQAFKFLTVLLFTVLFAASAAAQVNWLKQDGKVNYLAWSDGTKSKSIFSGDSATFATGYFGSTASKTVKLTVTLNSASGNNQGKIVSTIFSGDVDVSKTLAYKTFTVKPQDYQNTPGQYLVVIKLKDANTEYVDTSLFLQVLFTPSIFIPPATAIIPINPMKDTNPEINAINYDNDIVETENVQFTVSAKDKENDKLKFAIEECTASVGGFCFIWGSVQEASVSFNENTGAFSWIPGYEYVQHSIPSLTKKALFRFKAIEVNDNSKTSKWAFVSVTVHDVNRDPQLDPLDPKHIKQGEDTSFIVHATDADQDALNYSIFSTNLPKQSYTFDKDTQQFTFTHGFTSDGVYTTVFQVEDNFGGKDYAVSYIVITPAPKENTQCSDGKDNDGDGKIDYGNDLNTNDPGCSSLDDNDESDEPLVTQCNDGKDNDRDGLIDFGREPKFNDPGCKDKNDNDESDDKPVETQCNDHKDNDGDWLIDYGNDPRVNDPGCKSKDDNDETDEPVLVTQCDDGIDNDGDGKKDHPNDPGCSNKDDDNESDDPIDEPQCNDGKDNDNDEFVDLHDPGCSNKDDNNEADDPVKPQCDDGKDNDNDGAVDLHDPGCENPEDDDESNSDETPTPQPKPTSYTNIKFKSVFVEEKVYSGEIMEVHVHIFNNGKTNLEDVELQATIYDIGAFGSTSDFNLSKGKGASKTVFVPIPEEAQPGWHLVKITVKNYHYHTSTYRLTYIDSNTFQ